jgi:hypothetical protein
MKVRQKPRVKQETRVTQEPQIKQEAPRRMTRTQEDRIAHCLNMRRSRRRKTKVPNSHYPCHLQPAEFPGVKQEEIKTDKILPSTSVTAGDNSERNYTEH